MFSNNVTEDEIRAVMGVRGHFPIDTPFENIAATTPEYFEGGLVANWGAVVGTSGRGEFDIRKYTYQGEEREANQVKNFSEPVVGQQALIQPQT